MIDYIDDEEKEVIESLYSESWDSDFNEEIKKQYEEYARNYFDRKNKIEIKLTDNEFNEIQKKALQAGISYDALITLLIHNYN